MYEAPAQTGARTGAQPGWRSLARPRLTKLVREASVALSQLDADRLEELAACCEALNRDLPQPGTAARRRADAEVVEAAREMPALASLLEATRANLEVMHRLREQVQGRLEYGPSPVPDWQPAGGRYGDH